MPPLALFLFGAAAGIGTLWAALFVTAMRLAWLTRDINDAPCLACNRQQCECGE